MQGQPKVCNCTDVASLLYAVGQLEIRQIFYTLPLPGLYEPTWIYTSCSASINPSRFFLGWVGGLQLGSEDIAIATEIFPQPTFSMLQFSSVLP